MKTKLTTIFKKSANTPPMWVCLLFALVISTNCWADVTAEWGEWGSPKRTFPIGNEDNLNGIILTPSASITELSYVYVGGIDNYDTYNLNVSGKYVDISLSSGVISSVQFGVWTADATLLKIQFCKEATYTGDPADLLGDPQVMHDAVAAGSGLQTIIAPTNAKSARIYKDGSDHWQCYLYRLIVTAAAGCASPETATFAAGGSGNPTGSAPSNISRCEGSTFTMPGAGTLTWFGHKFTGWKLNNAGDLITAGTSYTMPAGGASFTAQWEEYVEPKIAEWGDYGVPATDFPSSSSSSTSLNGIELAYDVAYSTGGVGWYSAHTYYWVFDDNKYCNITLASSYSSQVISEVSACVWYTGYGSAPEMYIQFYSSATCSDGYEIGTPQLITGQVQTASTLSTHVPAAAGAKSARIYSLGEAFMCRLIVTRDDACSTVTASFAKAGSETGNVPGAIEVCEDGNLTIPDAGTLTWSRHAFLGWDDGSNTYAAGASYTMGDDDVEFTAVWEELVTPAVTNLTITDKENSNVPLSWKIPGKLDLSTATTSVSGYFINGQSAAGSYSYNSSTEELTVTYTASQWAQPGVAFPFTLSNLESVTFEYKGHRVFPEVVKADGTASYWDYDVIETAADWTKVTRTPVHTYSGSVSAAPLPAAKAITFCANPDANKTNESFYLRNVFYHVKDQVDIDHVVLMRKAGSATADTTDAAATKLYSGKLSHFTDDESKIVGTTYYYTVFAVDEDGYVSAATTVSATITNDTPHTVTYAKGDEAVDGSVPTDANTYVEGNNVTLAAIGDLAWSGHIFMGWSDGTDTYKPGDSYTMTDNDVTFTAQWRDIETPFIIPTGTTHLDANNYYAAPHGVYSFDVDGTGASTCIDIAANNYAEWKAKFTPGFYSATLAYGTTGYAVNVTLKIYDGETEVLTTTADTHSDGSGAHRYQKTWGLDLTNLDPNKAYFVRVIDTYSDATSNPKVGYLDFSMLVPTTIGDDALTRLDYNNITVSPGTVSFDVKNNSNPVTCLDIKDQNQADWYAYITPGYYKINLLYGTPEYSTNVSFSVIDASSGTPVFSPAAMIHNGSGGAHWYEDKTWPAVNLTGLDPNKQYIIRVKDTYSTTGSKPKVAYVEFTPLIVSVPTETRLDETNTISTIAFATDLDIDNDGNNDELMNLKKTNAEWQVKIDPGFYNVSLSYGVPQYSVKVSVKLIDPSGEEEDRYLSANPYYHVSGQASTPQRLVGTTAVDLTGITPNKTYKVQVSDEYGSDGCNLRVSHLTFATADPINVSNDDNTRLDKTNAFSTPATATDLDIDDDGNLDELMDLKNSSVNWLTKIEPGIYDVSLTYGTPSYSIKVSVKLINPDDGSVVKNLSVDGSHDYYYVSGEKDKPQRKVGVTKVDLSDINPNKTYKVQVSDEYGNDGCKLRVSHVEFAPITPISIVTGTSTRLDETNTYSSLTLATDLDIDDDGNADELMNLNKNKGNAAWIVQITPGIYDVKLIYGAPSYSIKVAVKLIDLSGEESVRYLSTDPYYYETGNENVPHHHISTTRCDMTGITVGKKYKVVIEDAYDGTYGCNLRVSHLEFARPVDTYTRTGLTVGNYGTICLPYAVAAEDIHGADIFDMQGWPAGSVAVVLNEVDNMEAGRPYVIQAKATTATWSYYPEGDPAAAGSHNGLIGSYTKEVIPANENNYMVYRNKLYYVDVLSYVGANKAYINRTLAEAAAEPVAPAPGKRQIRLFLDGEQVITDIDQINDQMTNTKYMENGILYILREGKVYNAQGQLVK